jgi:hypothetical protein
MATAKVKVGTVMGQATMHSTKEASITMVTRARSAFRGAVQSRKVASCSEKQATRRKKVKNGEALKKVPQRIMILREKNLRTNRERAHLLHERECPFGDRFRETRENGILRGVTLFGVYFYGRIKDPKRSF